MEEVNVYTPGTSKVTEPMHTPSMLPTVSSRKKETGLSSAVPSTLCVPSAFTKATVSPTEMVNSFGVKRKSVR